MKCKPITAGQIIKILRAHEAGAPLVDLVREHSFAEGTIHTRKAKYGGIEVAEANLLLELKVENKKLENLLAETMLERMYLKDALGQQIAI